MLKNIKIAILSSFFLIFLMFSVLFSGIKINSFHLFNFKISQFYIKLDKKLIVTIENMEYKSKKSEVKSSIDDLENSIELLPKLLKWFEKIDIQNLTIDGNSFKILLSEDEFNVENKFINLYSKIEISSKQISFDIDSLYLKDYEVLFKGKAKIDYFDEKLRYFGDIYYKDIVTKTNIDIEEGIAKFFIRSEYFKNIHFLKEFLDLPQTANEWMYDNVEGNFKLDWFYGEFDLEKNEIIYKTFEGEAHIKDAKVKFEQKLDAINTSSVKVSFNKDTLHFDLINPIYKNKNLNNSFVTIENLVDENNGKVLVNIEATTALDKDILEILAAYDITLPVVQKSGQTDAKLLLIFPYAENIKMSSKGEFLVNKSDISISNFNFRTNSAKVILDDELLYIKDSSFLYEDMIDANVDLKLQLDSLKSTGNVDINRVFIKDNSGESIIDIRGKKSNISMDFSKNLDIFLQDLKTSVKYDKFLTIKIDDISKIYQYSDILKANSIKSGNAFLKIIDDKRIEFEAYVSGFELPIRKYDSFVNSLNIAGNIDDKNIFINSKDNSIKVEIKDEISLYLDGYDIFYNTNISKTKDFSKNINVYLSNSGIIINDKLHRIEEAKATLKKDLITFEASIKEVNLPLKKDDKPLKELDLIGTYKSGVIDIYSKNRDIFLTIKNGYYSIKLDGYDVYHDIEDNNKYTEIDKLDIIGINSNIVINNKNKILSDFYELNLHKDRKFFYLEHENSKMSFSQNSNNEIDIYVSKANENFINSAFNSDIMNDGSIDFFANGSRDRLKGKMIIKNSSISNLSILNNIMFFLESSPALINPFLAIPSVLGLNKLGVYRVKEGVVEFDYDNNKNIIDIKNLHTVGNGIDFEGSGIIDLEKRQIASKIKLIFLKSYSSIFEYIPIINYILLGDEKRVETQIEISGSLNNPEISTNLIKDGFNAPINVFKRVFTSPANLINSLNYNKKVE